MTRFIQNKGELSEKMFFLSYILNYFHRSNLFEIVAFLGQDTCFSRFPEFAGIFRLQHHPKTLISRTILLGTHLNETGQFCQNYCVSLFLERVLHFRRTDQTQLGCDLHSLRTGTILHAITIFRLPA